MKNSVCNRTKKIWLAIVILILSTFTCVSIYANPLANTKKQFIDSISHQATIVNQSIQVDRARLKKLYAQSVLSAEDIDFLQKLSKRYGLSHSDFKQEQAWQLLLNRVDIVPPSLVVSQAIYESNWGQSRFAVEGNNYFGQRCFRTGCGLVPRACTKACRFEVKRFDSMYDSVASYMNNLNTHDSYQTFRDIRQTDREDDGMFNSVALAEGLSAYSEQSHYITSIQHIIRKYGLLKCDVVK